MTFSPQRLYESKLSQLPRASRWWIAYSGGLDSHCLLHAITEWAPKLPPLTAIHVNHGLNPSAAQWAAHCASVCAERQVPFQSLEVKVTPNPGESLEAAARTVRYSALAHCMGSGDVLLTAHHQDDQAETLLLQLLRGAGPRGLAAMPVLVPFYAGYLARPLLDDSRSALLAYARSVALSWIDDDSNAELRYQRNDLRHRVFPVLLKRWPGLSATLARSASHQAEAAQLLDVLAAQDLHTLLGPEPNTVQIPALLALGAARARNALRYWIRTTGHDTPTASLIERLLAEVVLAKRDAIPLLTWCDTEVRRYRDLLYLMRPAPPLPGPTWAIDWADLNTPLELPWGTLTAQWRVGAGIAESALAQGVTVRLRRGGERCRFVGNPHHRPLKDFWQEAGIPPWERLRTPLLFLGEMLVAVSGLGVCHDFQTPPGERGVVIVYANKRLRNNTVETYNATAV